MINEKGCISEEKSKVDQNENRIKMMRESFRFKLWFGVSCIHELVVVVLGLIS